VRVVAALLLAALFLGFLLTRHFAYATMVIFPSAYAAVVWRMGHAKAP
jgi:hypothetical protein